MTETGFTHCPMNSETLGIIAGGGHFPEHLAHFYDRGPVCVAGFYGQTDTQWIKQFTHQMFQIGQVGSLIRFFKSHQVSTVVMAGHFKRPSFKELRPDTEGLKLMAKIGMRWNGDDFIMTTIKTFLQNTHGFCVVSPQSIAPHILLTRTGALGHVVPDTMAMQDIHQGVANLATLSALDCGQGIALQNGVILGIEAAEGTDQCIKRCGHLAAPNGPAPIYIKRAKIQQSCDVDLPFVGMPTLRNLVHAGYQGLAIHCHKTVLLDLRSMIDYANTHQFFIWSHG